MSQLNKGVQVNRVPILKANDFDMWKIGIKQYILVTDYIMWDVIEYGPTTVQVPPIDGSKAKLPVPGNDQEKRDRQSEMKALCTLLLAIPNEYQHQFEKYTVGSMPDPISESNTKTHRMRRRV